MPITRPPYSPEFRQQIIDLARAGRNPVSLSKRFEPTAETIGKWVAAADRQEGGLRNGGAPVAVTACPRPSATSWPGCGARTGSCGWTATSSLERRPGSDARSARRALPRREGRQSRPGGRAVRLFGFMSANQATFPIAIMARVLGVSEAGYSAWRNRPLSAHALADAALLKRVRTVHSISRETYE